MFVKMGRYTIKQYRKRINKLKKDLIKSGDNSAAIASRFMQLRAKYNAPRKTGALAAGITRHKRKNGEWTVQSKVPGSFPYNQFVNQMFSITINKGGHMSLYFKPNQTIIYGQAALTPSGKQVNWTAMVNPFWDRAVKTARDRFRSTFKKKVKTALRG